MRHLPIKLIVLVAAIHSGLVACKPKASSGLKEYGDAEQRQLCRDQARLNYDSQFSRCEADFKPYRQQRETYPEYLWRHGTNPDTFNPYAPSRDQRAQTHHDCINRADEILRNALSTCDRNQVYAPYPTQQQLTPQQRYEEYLRGNKQQQTGQGNPPESDYAEPGSGEFDETSEGQEQGGDF